MTTNQDEFINIDHMEEYQEFKKNVTLGRMMRSWRKCEEWTLVDAATKLGISKQLLSRYERGINLPSLSKTIEIARVLGAPAEMWIHYRINDELNTLGYTANVDVKRTAAG